MNNTYITTSLKSTKTYLITIKSGSRRFQLNSYLWAIFIYVLS